MTKKKTPKDLDKLDFESALKDFEGLVEQLESGEMGLSESLKHFEQGVKLSRHCHGLLDEARQKVTVLSQPDDESSEEEFKLSDETSD